MRGCGQASLVQISNCSVEARSARSDVSYVSLPVLSLAPRPRSGAELSSARYACAGRLVVRSTLFDSQQRVGTTTMSKSSRRRSPMCTRVDKETPGAVDVRATSISAIMPAAVRHSAGIDDQRAEVSAASVVDELIRSRANCGDGCSAIS